MLLELITEDKMPASSMIIFPSMWSVEKRVWTNKHKLEFSVLRSCRILGLRVPNDELMFMGYDPHLVAGDVITFAKGSVSFVYPLSKLRKDV